MQSVILALALCFSQTPVTPEVTLNVPKKPVAFSRFIKMSISPIVQTSTDPYNFKSMIVDWDVTERAISDNPLENDLDIDSNGLKAVIPSGDHATSVKISVTVIFVYADYTRRVVKLNEYVQVGTGPTPGPAPTPTPIPPGPSPTPVPVPPVPTPVQEVFGMTTWTINQLKSLSTPLSKTEAANLGLGFHQIAQLTRNQSTNLTKQEVIDNMVAKNKATLGQSLNVWIDGFLQPLEVKLNPMSPKIKTVLDQATVFDEIGFGLDAYSK